MGKVETAFRSEVVRLSRRETRGLIAKLVGDLRRLRQRVAALEHEVRGLKAARFEEQLKTKVRTAAETAATDQAAAVRLSPRLIRTLRSRLDISQAELARLVSVSAVAVGSWESGKSRPRPGTKARIVALRSLGRREVRRLLAKQGT
jgi:DNA-binding transcriptional regulator YiaG